MADRFRHEHEKETFGSCDCFMTATTRVPSIMRPLFKVKFNHGFQIIPPTPGIMIPVS